MKRAFDDRLQREELIDSLKKGDEAAYAFLFAKYYPPLFSYACRIVNDHTEAEDCVQITFCNIWDARVRIDIRDSVKSYLYRSVYNTCISFLRKQKVLARYEESGELDLYFSRIIQSPNAEMRLIDSEVRTAIMNTLNLLPARCREIFIKCKIEGMSCSDVAKEMSISVSTVENQMYIAYKKLREKLNWLLLIFM
ncbi:MAG: RNA polymerase sigma factor [Bacteroidales bacterium]